MSKWLLKFQETRGLRTDNTDVVHKISIQQIDNVDTAITMSALSVPPCRVFPKNEDFRDSFNEHAAIMEYGGVLSPELAEYVAYLYVLQVFMRNHYPDIYQSFQSILKGVAHD